MAQSQIWLFGMIVYYNWGDVNTTTVWASGCGENEIEKVEIGVVVDDDRTDWLLITIVLVGLLLFLLL